MRTHHLAYLAMLLALTAGPLPRIAMAADAQLQINVVDRDTGKPIACRIHLQNAAGRPVKLPKSTAWGDHFVFYDKAVLKLPLGNYTFVMERGLEYLERSGHFRLEQFADDAQVIDMKRFCNMANEGWWSGDMDVQRAEKDLPLVMQADDLHVVPLVTFTNTRNEWTKHALPAKPLVQFDADRCFQLFGGEDARAGGAVGLLNLTTPLNLAGAKPEIPAPEEFIATARRQEGAWIDARSPADSDLPVWIAAGQIDSIEVLNRHFGRETMSADETGQLPRDKQLYPPPLGIGRWSNQVYFNLLNCGLRIPPSAGSGSGISTNPAGYNRVYVHCGSTFSYEKWWENFRAGQVIVTDGPLIRPLVEGQLPGHVFQAGEGEKVELQIALTLSTREPIRYLEVIQNGRVVTEARLEDFKEAGGKLPPVKFDQSGWFLVRAVTDNTKTYRVAMTGPYYVEIGYHPRISKKSVQFFLDWLGKRESQIKIDGDAERDAVLANFRKARTYWEALATKANAE